MAAREALIPHLLATLSIDWRRPPSDVAALLARVDALPWVEPPDDEAWDTRPGDPTRQARLRAARAEARALADGDSPLDLDPMIRVQAIALGEPAPVRTATAFARGGEEAYAWFPGLERMLRRKVAADVVDGCHPLVRACRLYLDLIYFHPFADGNARAARLWFEAVLRRARITGPPLTDVVRLAKAPGDVDAAWRLVRFAAERTVAPRCASAR